MPLENSSVDLMRIAREGLRAIGYRDDLLQFSYRFADPRTVRQPVRSIDLAAFAQTPPSYRSACLGVVTLPQNGYDGESAIAQYQALGAPQILGLHTQNAEVQRWKVVAQGTPQLIERIEPNDLYAAILEHREEWSPEQILRAKSVGFRSSPIQLDFFDAGLVPTIEGVVQEKLDLLLRQVIAECQALYNARHGREPDYQALFRLIFRLFAAKLLLDRGHSGGDWGSSDPQQVLQNVETYYFGKTVPEKVLEDRAVQQVAWDQIRSAFHFSNISVETLAFVYENTLVSGETRRRYDVHATPPEIAEYMVRMLPFEELPQEERRVFEPFAGHAPFLIASLGRLRMLLPSGMSPNEKHSYFVRMLCGIEIDSFATEIASNALMMADYPNSDGWRIINDNAFTSSHFDAFLSDARVVLCNPPYGRISSIERERSRPVQSSAKAAEALRRVLEQPPRMLGFVLPRVFVNGESYRSLRDRLRSLYGDVEIVGLPDEVFVHSEIPTVLLLAHGAKTNGTRLRTANVERGDYKKFSLTGQPTWQTEAPLAYLERPIPILWYSPEQRIVDELLHLPRLGDIADIHRGIEYNVPFRENEDQLVSASPRPGFAPGLVNTEQGFEPFVISDFRYLNMSTEFMLYQAHLRPWNRPKVIANASRIGTDRWVVAAAVDQQGLVCYQRFHGIWPKEGFPVEVLAAVLNGPVANAFVNIYLTGWDIQIRVVRQIPVPSLTTEQAQNIIALVTSYRSYRQRWLATGYDDSQLEEHCRALLWQIDAEVLNGYDLSPRLERKLLDYFNGYRRPGPVHFDRYYPPDFRPSVPWSVFISEGFQASTATRTLQRLPVIYDPAVSNVVRDLTE